LRLHMDTRVRTDTNTINSTPISSMFPLVYLRTGIQYPLKITYYDADNDVVRCRWAEYSYGECGGDLNFLLNFFLTLFGAFK
jgi:hypothetical protein